SVSFVFSSRRRHTRSKRDWSSDVCSSDLWTNATRCRYGTECYSVCRYCRTVTKFRLNIYDLGDIDVIRTYEKKDPNDGDLRNLKIGRASCRKRTKAKEGKQK